jgi:hypothetical protein
VDAEIKNFLLGEGAGIGYRRGFYETLTTEESFKDGTSKEECTGFKFQAETSNISNRNAGR